ncbi:hypothetical protein Micbo1qcDRAFT_153554 [Microdochium bolleyi]|uniref:RING-type E3 ubiquitin transferase n=1 Tax=Microdochium bolleyi TaxID=196109 RepID=A0A136ILR6_9PEZI|nr:hypothetical protein Micbo1qcDRAFT_153554 [Microdochium bolleyi]
MEPALSGIDRPSSSEEPAAIPREPQDGATTDDVGALGPTTDPATELVVHMTSIDLERSDGVASSTPPGASRNQIEVDDLAPTRSEARDDELEHGGEQPGHQIEDSDAHGDVGGTTLSDDRPSPPEAPADHTEEEPHTEPDEQSPGVDSAAAHSATDSEDAASSSDDESLSTPQERRMTLLEALNDTRDSADHYSSTVPVSRTDDRGNGRAVPEDTSPPLPASPPPPPPHPRPSAGRSTSEFILPRWQPDAEVTLCPICSTQFGIFVRKHHCRKCGRVVCNSCSPHRIVIPHQYIVRPPGEYPFPPFPQAGDEGGIADFSGVSGGERVRLCNPCVPDPNTTPPRSQALAGNMSPRTPHQRSHSSSDTSAGVESSGSNFQPFPISPRADAHARSRSITVNSGAGPSNVPGPSGYYSRSARRAGERPGYYSASYSASSVQPGHGSRRHHDGAGLQSAINRPLPPAPQIPEEDECPVCHLELPSRDLPDAEARREAHINDCISYHSAYNPRRATLMAGTGAHGTPPPRTERRTGMFPYVATEKDCVDDAECTICFEEYEAGDQMCRLECLCRFHRICIAAWFETHPGRCPVHQHDSYGY